MQTDLAVEIANKLNLSVDAVNKSNAIKNTFMTIKNDPQLTADEKENMYREMADIYRNLVKESGQD